MYPTKILNQHGQFHCHSWIPKAVLQLKIFYKIDKQIHDQHNNEYMKQLALEENKKNGFESDSEDLTSEEEK